jgi:hypothetical protein
MPKNSRSEADRKPIRREQARSRIGSVADRPDRARPGADPNFAVKLWSVPGAAAALVEVQALAPRLSSLLYDLAVPERPLHALLDWAEAAVEPGSLAAFELPQLRAVLPAMLTVFIATHTYRMADLGDGPGLVLDDTGQEAWSGGSWRSPPKSSPRCTAKRGGVSAKRPAAISANTS